MGDYLEDHAGVAVYVKKKGVWVDTECRNM